jgi:hypothetical protein
MVRYRIKGKIEMRNAETINEIVCLTDSELDLVAGGAPTHYEFGASYGWEDLACDFWGSFAGSPWMGNCHP